MSWIEIISALLGLSCVFLAGRNSKYNFWVGYVYNIFLFVLFWRQHLYSAMLLQPVSFAINAFGHWRWTHPREEERSAADECRLKVGHISKERWPGIALMVCVFGAVWAMCLDWLPVKWPDVFQPDPSPWLDSYLLMFTLLAQYLSAQKCWECWIVWLVVNAANIVLYITSGLYLMPVVSLLYLANGIWSLISWKKLYNKNE